ncbi:MAG: efflux RND transporter permease subunit [Planctomycetes bacterium]|nr:efflux RND transporter permease subunit [Planctomycetota bacterium]
MNLVQLALRRPITVVVAVVTCLLGAILGLRQIPRDIFPDLGVPIIYVAQPYGGMDPAQMEGYLVNYYEYHFLYITGIEHVESKSIQGAGLIKLQFHPGTNMAQAMAETISYVNRARAFMPPGTVPPFVMRFDAGSIPIGNLVFRSDTRSVAELQDLALFRVRPLFATLPGVSAPPPFGASQRAIVVRVNPDRLRAYNMSPDEVVSAISNANIIMPSGNVRIGDKIPMVPVNSVVTNIKELESVPIRGGARDPVYVHDIGIVEDASDIATGYALVNGKRTVYIPVTKRADASTLAVVDLVKDHLAQFQSVLPDDVEVSYQFDQSPYVVAAMNGLLLEGLLGAALTGLTVLLFLRDWRSALIIIINIPLSLLCAALGLWVTRETVNIMTLGGLALAVGILVDEATVTIENLHTHLDRGATVARAARTAATETALPRFLAMVCLVAVFLPSLFMAGVARSLFVPLSLAVGFSMAASYFLSSTLVPVLSVWLLRPRHGAPAKSARGLFDRTREFYTYILEGIIRNRWTVVIVYVAITAGLFALAGSRLGSEIFPNAAAEQFQLRMRAPAGTRIEQTEALALQTLKEIESEAGAKNIDITLGFVGVQPPSYPINTIHLWTAGPDEAVLQVGLKRDARIPIEDLKERLRRRLHEAIPQASYSFEAGDIVSRVMSLGSPTPIEIAVSGPNLDANRAFAQKIKDALEAIPSLRDIQFGQTVHYPTIDISIDRQRAGLMGIKTADVTRSLVAATSSSRFVVPNFWADPNSGVGYQIQIEIPQATMNSKDEIANIPISRGDEQSVLLRDIASVNSGTRTAEFDRYNMQRMTTITANISGEDLGSASAQVAGALKALGQPPAKVSVAVRGQVASMQQMRDGLQGGLLLSVAAIFLLLAANFQSIRLAFVVIATVPAVIAGVVCTLWLTGTTLNIQSFTGAIMAIGVAVANAILLITFAEKYRAEGGDSTAAAVRGAASRFRAIVMTSIAMIAGMLPMALAVGEGGEQTASLGRAVIGGLLFATISTLVVLPSLFSLVQPSKQSPSSSLDPDDSKSIHWDGADAAHT